MNVPTYLITWTTYGTWLHGDERGSVDRVQNTTDQPRLDASPSFVARDARQLKHDPFTLSDADRKVVGTTVRDHCERRGWNLNALNVRTNHVHVVCTAPDPPEKVMGEFKAWSTRRLRQSRPGIPDRLWTSHGSTRWIDSESSFQRAITYVRDEQGSQRFR